MEPVAPVEAKPPFGDAPATGSAPGVTSTATYGTLTTYAFYTVTNGYRQDVELSFGPPARATAAANTVPSACQANPQKDLVVPFTLTIRNSTATFGYQVSYQFSIVGAMSDQVFGFIMYSDSSVNCEDWLTRPSTPGPRLGMQSKAELTSGQAITAKGMIGYRDFFGPTGEQRDRFKQILINLGSSEKGAGATGIRELKGGQVGQGWVDGHSYADSYFVPIDGMTSPCAARPKDKLTCR